MVLAQVFTFAFCVYALIGCISALWLLALGGLVRIEPKAASASLGARVLWVPACIALWPVLITKARQLKNPPQRAVRAPVMEKRA